jgi:hypothetical protein
LKNKIYDYYVEREPPEHYLFLRQERPVALPLAQVCKQIRLEYRPIYVRNIPHVGVHWRDLPAFLSTFFESKDYQNCPERMGIWVGEPQQDNVAMGGREVDLLPLLHMQEQRPGFACKIDNAAYDTGRQRTEYACKALKALFSGEYERLRSTYFDGKHPEELKVKRSAPGDNSKYWLEITATMSGAVHHSHDPAQELLNDTWHSNVAYFRK